MKRSAAYLPLHGGKAPPWLFRRMTKLAEAITQAIVAEYGPHEMLRRLSDPWWFQAFGCVLGFDWHSSGVTTVTCGALKNAFQRAGDELGILVAGGKGAVSRKTPGEIETQADRLGISNGARLVYASRMSAKVDSAAVQDGFGIYQHAFFFTPDGHWCVVQQGMNETQGWARRYHWLGDSLEDFVCEPHEAIRDLSDSGAAPAGPPSTVAGPVDASGSTSDGISRRRQLLNLVAGEADDNRRATTALTREHPERMLNEITSIVAGPTLFAPQRHRVLDCDVNLPRLKRLVLATHEQHPQDFERLLGLPGIGPEAIRSLSLIAEIIFEAPASRRDPTTAWTETRPPERPDASSARSDRSRRWADYAYAHGGKDGTPFPVDRETYDRNIAALTDAVRQARLGQNDKFHALRRLARHAAES